jgi:hypothetical protein
VQVGSRHQSTLGNTAYSTRSRALGSVSGKPVRTEKPRPPEQELTSCSLGKSRSWLATAAIQDLARGLGESTPAGLRRKSKGTRWGNEELLFT